MNDILHYLLKNRLLPKEGLRTTEGETIRIIQYGNEGENENIFCDAQIFIGDKERYGDIVTHNKSSDWEKDTGIDPCMSGKIILHITTENDCERLRRDGKLVPQLCIELPGNLQEEFKAALQHSRCLQCKIDRQRIGDININSILSRLLVERIEDKADNIQLSFSECNGRWDDTLLKTIIRSFGFGIQGDVFEKWAKILDMNALGKHRDNPLQIEAIMFGQAGLLDEKSIPHYYLAEALKNEYYMSLCNEYKFLKNKFNLQSIGHEEWRNGSNATPHVRIARIATLYISRKTDIAHISTCNTVNDYYNLIDTTLSGYWSNHTCFGGTATIGNGSMKQRQMDVIIINAIAPTLYIYGKHRNDNAICSKAEDLLHNIKGEENSIIRKWREKGLVAECAADSQAILQLERKYCRMHDCTNCRFAYYYIKERMAEL